MESNIIENDKQVAGIQKCECELIQTQGSYMFILFLIIEFRKSCTINGKFENSWSIVQLDAHLPRLTSSLIAKAACKTVSHNTCSGQGGSAAHY